MYVSPNIQLTLVVSISLVSSTPLLTLPSILLILIKRGYRRFQKYPIQTNLFTSSDICFMIDNLHYDNVNMRLPSYTLSK